MTDVAPIITRVGHYSTDELRFRGRRVFGELLGHSSFAQVLMLGLIGRFLEGEELATIDDIMTAMSSADPRLWPFKVTRLASAYGVGANGIGATLVASQGGIFGGNRMQSAATWLLGLHRRASGTALDDDAIAAEIEQGAQAFGVLYRARDERLEALLRQIAKRGRHQLPHTRTCLDVIRVARARLQLEAHVYLGIAALCLDLGMSTHEIGMFGLVVLFHDALANATEGAEQCPTVLRQLPVDRVDYLGRTMRDSPRACTRT